MFFVTQYTLHVQYFAALFLPFTTIAVLHKKS